MPEVTLTKKEGEHTSYYRHLAETVIRAWEHHTCPHDKIYQFLDFGLTHGPSDEWPDTLVEAWSIGKIPSPNREWPYQEHMESLVNHCRIYLNETV